MAQVLKLKRTAVQGKSPTADTLELGELAINTYDGKLYFEKDDGVPSIQSIVVTDALITGSLNINGAITASYFKGNGSQITFGGTGMVSGSSQLTSSLDSRYLNTLGEGTISGSFTGSFGGDGSGLTNLPASDISQVATVNYAFFNSSNISVSHNFNSRNVIISVYDSNYAQIIPSSVTLTDLNTATIVLTSAQSGYAVVAKGGHIVSGSADDSNKLNNQSGSYYLDYTNHTNKPSGLVSGSSQIVTILSSLNSYTSSQDTKNSTLTTYTASIDTSLSNQNTKNSTLATYTASLDTKNTTLATYTASLDTKNSTLSTTTGSLISSASNIALSSSNIDGKFTTLATYTSSLDTKNLTLAIISGSLNSYTSSQDTKNSTLSVLTASMAGQILRIQESTSSLNTYTSSLKTALELTGSNVIVLGDLTVRGTTTSVNSTTIQLGDNIIELNGNGSVNGGLLVKDVTGGSTISGSLLWDSTNDYWKSGISGSESKILLANGDSIVSGSSQITITSTTGYSTFSSSLNSRFDNIQLYTSSQDTKNSTLAIYTASLDTKNTTLGTYTASLDTKNITLGTYTGSLETKNSTLGTTTGSLISSASNIAVSSSNIDIKFTTLQNVTASLLSATSSYETRGNSIISSSAQIVSSLVSQSINLANGAITASYFKGDGSGITNVVTQLSEVATITASFDNQSTITATHNFNSKNILVSVYGTNDSQIIPSSVTLTNNNTATIILSSAQSGYAVVAKGGHIVSGSTSFANLAGTPSGLVSGSSQITALTTYKETVSGNSTYSITHSLNEEYPIVQAWNTTNKRQEVPSIIESTSVNALSITFAGVFAGLIIITK
jgi:hypothetical protein